MKSMTTLASLAATAIFCGLVSSGAMAAPISLNLTGTVIGADGNWAGNVGTAFGIATTFDLDEANLHINASGQPAKDSKTPTGEDPYTVWTFDDTPYGGSLFGAFGGLTTNTVRLETIDNFNADAAGNPFGVTGIVDVLSVGYGQFLSSCVSPDPVTGCPESDTPTLSGEEYQLLFVANQNWFDGIITLPSSLSPIGGLIGVFAAGEQITAGVESAAVQIDFGNPSLTFGANSEEPVLPVNPDGGAEGVFEFEIPVVADQLVFIDPIIAIGYDYMTGESDPNFATIELPDIGDGLYDLILFDALGNIIHTELDLAALTSFDFTQYVPGGVSRFRVLGIEESVELDPNDPAVFVTGLTFVGSGQFTGSMTPITVDTDAAQASPVPEPGTFALFALGLAGLGFMRRRRAA